MERRRSQDQDALLLHVTLRLNFNPNRYSGCKTGDITGLKRKYKELREEELRGGSSSDWFQSPMNAGTASSNFFVIGYIAALHKVITLPPIRECVYKVC